MEKLFTANPSTFQ